MNQGGECDVDRVIIDLFWVVMKFERIKLVGGDLKVVIYEILVCYLFDSQYDFKFDIMIYLVFFVDRLSFLFIVLIFKKMKYLIYKLEQL